MSDAERVTRLVQEINDKLAELRGITSPFEQPKRRKRDLKDDADLHVTMAELREKNPHLSYRSAALIALRKLPPKERKKKLNGSEITSVVDRVADGYRDMECFADYAWRMALERRPWRSPRLDPNHPGLVVTKEAIKFGAAAAHLEQAAGECRKLVVPLRWKRAELLVQSQPVPSEPQPPKSRRRADS